MRQARDGAGKSWYDLTAQAFAVFLPVRSVGVMGDGRTYEHVVALRAVQTTDFMTAHWAPLPHDLLAQGVESDHQRSARHQSRRLRHLEQAAGDDRVGVIATVNTPAEHPALSLFAGLPSSADSFRASFTAIANAISSS